VAEAHAGEDPARLGAEHVDLLGVPGADVTDVLAASDGDVY
jgi:hypothetical protein